MNDISPPVGRREYEAAQQKVLDLVAECGPVSLLDLIALVKERLGDGAVPLAGFHVTALEAKGRVRISGPAGRRVVEAVADA